MGSRVGAAYVAISAAAMVLLAVPAFATCPGPVSLDDQFRSYSTVFVGRAVDQQLVTRTEARPDQHATETTFEIETIWKGDATTRVQVRTCSWTDGIETVTCSEDVYFRVGSRYVVFATGTPLETSGCSPTSLVNDASVTMAWLSEKPHKTVR